MALPQAFSQVAEMTHIVHISPMRDIVVLVLPGVLDAALALLVEVLDAGTRVRVARGMRPAYRVTTRGAHQRIVRTGLGQDFRTDGALASFRGRADVVVVTGQNLVDPDALIRDVRSPGRARLSRWLARVADDGARICAACTGVFHVAQAGLLDGHSATTTWFLAPRFRAEFPAVELHEHSTLVRDRRRWTAGAALSMTDLALALVSDLAGRAVERDVARYLLLERHPTQARYMMATHFAAQDPTVARAEAWVRGHLERPLRVPALARAMGLSERTLARRLAAATGLSPIRFVQRVRAEQAAHLLETSTGSVDEIARRVGYGDASSLRRILARELELNARSLRASRAESGAHRPRV